MTYNDPTMFIWNTHAADLHNEIKSPILSIRDLDSNSEKNNLTGEQVKEEFAEMFLDSQLFDCSIHYICPLSTIIFGIEGAAINSHSWLATIIHTVSEDTNTAVELAKDMISSSRASSNNTAQLYGTENYIGEQGEASSLTFIYSCGIQKLSHNVAMRFKYSDNRFSGNIGESWIEYVSNYQRVAIDYNLNPEQKLTFFQNIFRETTRGSTSTMSTWMFDGLSMLWTWRGTKQLCSSSEQS